MRALPRTEPRCCSDPGASSRARSHWSQRPQPRQASCGYSIDAWVRRGCATTPPAAGAQCAHALRSNVPRCRIGDGTSSTTNPQRRASSCASRTGRWSQWCPGATGAPSTTRRTGGSDNDEGGDGRVGVARRSRSPRWPLLAVEQVGLDLHVEAEEVVQRDAVGVAACGAGDR